MNISTYICVVVIILGAMTAGTPFECKFRGRCAAEGTECTCVIGLPSNVTATCDDPASGKWLNQQRG